MVDFTMIFPRGFLWGTATAAHQVEGGSPSNTWSRWESNASHIYQGQQVGAACARWGGRYVEDFDRAAALNNNAHRFSIEWSRIEPEPEIYDEDALDHYARMVEALRARRMAPVVTLHHFTEPLWLADRGGWANPETPRHFARFARRVAEALGDHVTLWCTINEPMVYTHHGYLTADWPPGKRNPWQMLRVIEHLVRGHAEAYHAIKDVLPNAQIGLAKHQVAFKPAFPATLNWPALAAIRGLFNEVFVRALMTGVLRLPLRTVRIPQARNTLDWIGLNYYYRYVVGFHPLYPHQLFIRYSQPRDGIRGPEGVGEIWPEGLFDQIKWLSRATGKPIYITETGVPAPDDALRRLYLIRSVRSVWQAINHNYPVKGYFFWTLVDNFEWAEGYDPAYRFGLYSCDPVTQARTKRRSAALYGELCKANALTADMARRYVPDEADVLFPGVPVQAEVQLTRR